MNFHSVPLFAKNAPNDWHSDVGWSGYLHLMLTYAEAPAHTGGPTDVSSTPTPTAPTAHERAASTNTVASTAAHGLDVIVTGGWVSATGGIDDVDGTEVTLGSGVTLGLVTAGDFASCPHAALMATRHNPRTTTSMEMASLRARAVIGRILGSTAVATCETDDTLTDVVLGG